MQLKSRVWDSVEKRFLEPGEYWLNSRGELYFHSKNGEPYGIPMAPTATHIVSYSTGLTDKNKVEIYSDDIIKTARAATYLLKSNCLFRVIFKLGGFYAVTLDGKESLLLVELLAKSKIKIEYFHYQNHELLEAKA